VLDHDALEPGGRATAAIRDIADQLGLKAKYGADVTLTGPVIISDNEFAGVHEGIALNSAVTGAIVLIILWLALRSLRLVAAVAVNIGVGLLITAAGGLLMVGVAGLCGSVRRARRRLRHPVHGSLSGGAPRPQ
jgi:uncharacterized membrane protein YdfJ with MMPL/SSD domain